MTPSEENWVTLDTDQGDVAGAGADEGVPDGEAGADVALGVGEAMRGPVGAQATGIGEGPGIAAVGLHRAGPGGVHGGEVGISHDEGMAELLQAAGDPLAFGMKPLIALARACHVGGATSRTSRRSCPGQKPYGPTFSVLRRPVREQGSHRRLG